MDKLIKDSNELHLYLEEKIKEIKDSQHGFEEL